jgi:thiol:disulfide interchange protein DsbD
VEQITNNSSLASGLLLSLVAAFLGGLLLNLMPCVFPVLSIKILSFAQAPSPSTTQGLKSASHLTGGLLYGLGVVLSFALLAVLLLALRAAGQALGWGFQLQSPWVIGALMAFFVAIALNLLGVFELKSFLPSGVAAWRAQNPNVDHFLSGVLAVLVASPCTAPFMGAALGAALTYPTWAALSVFIALGLGMALPYVLLAAFPAWLRFLPKPGAWMLRFKQWMALPMLLTVAWLAWVLYQQLVPPKVTQSPVLTHAVAGEWQPWSLERERTLLEAKEIVFVDYTAAWCITCQVNKRTTLDANEVKAKFKEKKVNLLQADWTRYDPAITESLRKLGRSGIPVYVLYAPGKSPKLFTEFLSKESLLEELNRL